MLVTHIMKSYLHCRFQSVSKVRIRVHGSTSFAVIKYRAVVNSMQLHSYNSILICNHYYFIGKMQCRAIDGASESADAEHGHSIMICHL